MNEVTAIIGTVVTLLIAFLTTINTGVNSSNRFESELIETQLEKRLKFIFKYIIIFTAFLAYAYVCYQNPKNNLSGHGNFQRLATFMILSYLPIDIIITYLLRFKKVKYYREEKGEKLFYSHINPKLKIVYLESENNDYVITDTLENDMNYKKYQKTILEKNIFHVMYFSKNFRLNTLKVNLLIGINILLLSFIPFIIFKEYYMISIKMIAFPLLFSNIYLLVGFPYFFCSLIEILKRRKQNKAPTQKSE